jgi:hypothetical protein
MPLESFDKLDRLVHVGSIGRDRSRVDTLRLGPRHQPRF